MSTRQALGYLHQPQLSGMKVTLNGQGPTGHDLEVGTVAEVPACIPPSDQYIVAFLRAERGVFCGRGRIFLWFRIVEPSEHKEKRLYLCCVEPSNKKFGLGSKFVASWMIATKKYPARRDRLSTDVFRNKYFRAEVKTVTKNQNGTERPPTQWYSKVERLIEIAAGSTNLHVNVNQERDQDLKQEQDHEHEQ
jgi:hypothetical protein